MSKSKSILRRLIVVLALSALLGSPTASLAGSRSAEKHPRTQAAVQTPLSRLWNALVSAGEKAGCLVDPSGRCLVSVQENSDAGCAADPYGRCIPGH
jgi:hypothetical protein